MNRLFLLVTLLTLTAGVFGQSDPTSGIVGSNAGHLRDACKLSQHLIDLGELNDFRSIAATPPTQLMDAARCQGYISGWLAATDLNVNIHVGTVTNGQVERVFILWVNRHPEAEGWPVNVVLQLALKEFGLLTISVGQ